MQAHRQSDKYIRDDRGRRIMVGLSYEETLEFENLDRRHPVDDLGHVLSLPYDLSSATGAERRWLQLYQSHRTACERLSLALLHNTLN